MKVLRGFSLGDFSGWIGSVGLVDTFVGLVDKVGDLVDTFVSLVDKVGDLVDTFVSLVDTWQFSGHFGEFGGHFRKFGGQSWCFGGHFREFGGQLAI